MSVDEFNDKVVSLSPKMLRFAARLLGDGQQAADVVQDVLERMWTRRLVLNQCHNIEAFVMCATRNRSYDVLRRRQVFLARHEPLTDKTHAVTMDVETEEKGLVVARAIEALPARQRAAIHLRDVEDYRFDEIAEIMGCSVAHVRVYLSRARKTVSEKVKKYMML